MKTGKHKKLKKETSTSLPDDIIEEILMRLSSSVKSLLRFKCVSKSWCSLSSCKRFVKMHLQKSLHSTPLSDYDAIMMSLPHKSYKKTNVIVNHCPVSSLFSGQSISIAQFNLGHDKVHNEANKIVVGYSTGLCCILLGEVSFILLNPSTKQSYKLPSVFENINKFKPVFLAGFGYDEFNDDYKVFVVLWKRYQHNYVVRLYSMKTNSWRTLNKCSGYNVLVNVDADNYGFGGNGVLLNGKLHWKKESDKFPYTSMKIVSFDLASEVVEIIRPPRSEDRCWRIGVLDGCLAVYGSMSGSTEVWVMKEYKVKESWCRLMTIPSLVRVYFDRSCIPPYPVCISTDGDQVFVINNYKNFIYNPQTKLGKPLEEIDNLDQRNLGDIVFSVQSLVSPFPDGEVN